MISSKVSVARLLDILKAKAVKNVVCSPGSRNAPLVISFNNDDFFDCRCITDERSAAFFAVGMAQKTRTPVIICCTSGSAALNYAPAIAEAYYQKIPLIVLTADRPQEWIDQGEGQSIRQHNVYSNYIKKSITLTSSVDNEDDLWYNDRRLCEVVDLSTQGNAGPVHINIPFREPLYDTVAKHSMPPVKIIETSQIQKVLHSESLAKLKSQWLLCSKKMILSGQLIPDSEINVAIRRLSQDPSVIILTETTSNVILEDSIANIDRVITTFSEAEKEAFGPDLLITIGDAIVSKKIKSFLRKNKAQFHWHVHPEVQYYDTFQSLTDNINISPDDFLNLLPLSVEYNSYRRQWLQRNHDTSEGHSSFFEQAQWSDLLAYHMVLHSLPQNVVLQMANSTAVRYVQLFEQRSDIAYYSNRGESVIDGSSSTAAGFAAMTERQVVLLTGDLAFLYDGNAFWNDHISPNLKVVLFNNSGGGIFRIIPGPDTTDQLETYFEAHHDRSAKMLAQSHDLAYYSAENADELTSILDSFFSNEHKASILEIFTPRLENDNVLKRYFESVKNYSTQKSIKMAKI